MLLNLPPAEPNNRYFEDTLAPCRPSLAFAGFDGQAIPGGGNGLKQALEKCQDTRSHDHFMLKALQLKAEQPMMRGGASAVAVANTNSSILQARAVVALVSLVLRQNNVVLHSIMLPAHHEAQQRLLEGIQGRYSIMVHEANPRSRRDREGWTRALLNCARALDLYLAIENAYRHYGLRDKGLLSRPDKRRFLARFSKGIHNVREAKKGFWRSNTINSKSLYLSNVAALAAQAGQAISRSMERQLQHWFTGGVDLAGIHERQREHQPWPFWTTGEHSQ